MNRLIRVFPVLFFLSFIGADKCGFGDPFTAPPPPPPPPPKKPFCMTDPPRGCIVTCIDVNLTGFSDACSDISAGPLTQGFINTVQKGEANFEAQGKDFCTAADAAAGRFITPCQIGIVPNQVESSDACMAPPPGCSAVR